MDDPLVPFWLRIFCNNGIDVVELPETITF